MLNFHFACWISTKDRLSPWSIFMGEQLKCWRRQVEEWVSDCRDLPTSQLDETSLQELHLLFFYICFFLFFFFFSFFGRFQRQNPLGSSAACVHECASVRVCKVPSKFHPLSRCTYIDITSITYTHSAAAPTLWGFAGNLIGISNSKPATRKRHLWQPKAAAAAAAATIGN